MTFLALAGKETNDLHTFREMLKQPDTAAFIQAMKEEAN